MSETIMRSSYPVLCDLCGIHIDAGSDYRRELTFNFHMKGECPKFGNNKDRLIDQLSDANASIKQQLSTTSKQLADAQARVKELETIVRLKNGEDIWAGAACKDIREKDARIKDLTDALATTKADRDKWFTSSADAQARVKELEGQVLSLRCCSNCDNHPDMSAVHTPIVCGQCDGDYSNWQPKQEA